MYQEELRPAVCTGHPVACREQFAAWSIVPLIISCANPLVTVRAGGGIGVEGETGERENRDIVPDRVMG